MIGDAPIRAWVDESGSHVRRDPGTYVLAAAVGRRDAEDKSRDRMRRLRLPGQVKLHWRDEGDKRRAEITQAVEACELDYVVVVRAGAVHDRPERRRRKCLERLLFELEPMGVAEVVLESRGPADDRRDIEMLNALRSQRSLSTSTRLIHLVGRREPMLWIPDVLCGVVTSSRTGVIQHRQTIEHRLSVIEI